MYTRLIITAVSIFSFITLSAYSITDSLIHFRVNPITRPVIYSEIKIGRDTSINLIAAPSRVINQNNIAEDEATFYSNLRYASQKWNLTRWLHEMLVKDQPGNLGINTEPMNSESQFLKHEGKTIRDIKLSRVNLFGGSIEDPNYSPQSRLERAGILLHFNTREKIIRNNLLFSEGEKIDPFTIADNERLLRQLSYLEDARIYVFEDIAEPDYADVIVVTRDRWSRGFDMDLSDVDEGRIEFYDRNLFGFGQEVQGNLLFDGGEDRVFGYKAEFNLYNVGRTFLRSRILYLDAFNNRTFHINAGRNFLTPSMKYAGGIEFTASSLIDDFFFPDTVFINQSLDYNEYDYWTGRSFLFPGRDLNNRSNFYVTARFNRQVYFKRPDIGETVRYDFHNRNLFLMGFTFTRLGYLKNNFIYEFGPTEDIPVGTKAETIAGYENNQFFPRIYAGMNLSHSHYFYRAFYWKNSFSAGGFFNDGTFEQGLLSFKSSGFSNLKNISRNFFLRQFLSLNYTRGIRRFDDELISISNREGIRGLRSENMKGTQKMTLQTETMFYSKINWYGFRYAFYAMADFGWIGTGKKAVFKEDFYSGIGLGLRVRNERLVLPTLQIRLAFFPKLPEAASAKLLYILTERSHLTDDFRVTAPDILPYR